MFGDLVIHSVKEKYESHLIKYVVTKLYGKALETVRYKNILDATK